MVRCQTEIRETRRSVRSRRLDFDVSGIRHGSRVPAADDGGNLTAMKGRASYLLYAVLALAVGFWVFSRLGGEERRIRSQLGALEDLLDKDGAENDLTAANKARNVGLLFTREFEIMLRGQAAGTVNDRQRVSQVMLSYRRQAGRIDVTFRDVEIEIDRGALGADMSTVGVVSATTDGNLSRRQFRLAFRWEQEDCEWRIRRAELVEELEGFF